MKKCLLSCCKKEGVNKKKMIAIGALALIIVGGIVLLVKKFKSRDEIDFDEDDTDDFEDFAEDWGDDFDSDFDDDEIKE
ncbi:MAG: hypothetical protein ACOX1S_08960 [Anaerostipes sp.]|jgi:hypothetical protein